MISSKSYKSIELVYGSSDSSDPQCANDLTEDIDVRNVTATIAELLLCGRLPIGEDYIVTELFEGGTDYREYTIDIHIDNNLDVIEYILDGLDERTYSEIGNILYWFEEEENIPDQWFKLYKYITNMLINRLI